MCILTFYIAFKFSWLRIRLLVFFKQFNKYVWIEIVEKLNDNDLYLSIQAVVWDTEKESDSFVQLYTIFVGSSGLSPRRRHTTSPGLGFRPGRWLCWLLYLSTQARKRETLCTSYSNPTFSPFAHKCLNFVPILTTVSDYLALCFDSNNFSPKLNLVWLYHVIHRSVGGFQENERS